MTRGVGQRALHALTGRKTNGGCGAAISCQPGRAAKLPLVAPSEPPSRRGACRGEGGRLWRGRRFPVSGRRRRGAGAGPGRSRRGPGKAEPAAAAGRGAVLSGAGSAMRLTQGMCSIAECAAPGGDGPAARPRLVKIAVVGGSGVGKTGEGGARRRRRREGKGGRGAWLTPVCACPQRSWCGS